MVKKKKRKKEKRTWIMLQKVQNKGICPSFNQRIP